MIDGSVIQEVLIELEEMKNISKKNIATIEDEIEELKSKKLPQSTHTIFWIRQVSKSRGSKRIILMAQSL